MSINIVELQIEFTFKGTIIDRYQGASGIIYILENPPYTIPRRIAVKTINSERLGKLGREAVQRFKRELETWYKLADHPIILRPFVIELISGLPYIAMPFCDATLRQVIDKDELSPAERISIAWQSSYGLAKAQEVGLIAHQDLKPDNILLQSIRDKFVLPPDYPVTWRIRIADFGLANAFSQINVFDGSRPYMAPEQYKKKADLSKADVFALGVIFTELFTGYHPVGVPTTELWPVLRPGAAAKWKHERAWAQWASRGSFADTIQFPKETHRAIISQMIEPDSNSRLSMSQVASCMGDLLHQEDNYFYECVRVSLQQYDNLSSESQSYAKENEAYARRELEKFSRVHLKESNNAEESETEL
jgi:serine/threonine protein kinase